MSQFMLSSSDVLALRLALLLATHHHPEADEDFPFDALVLANLSDMLDSVLATATPNTTYECMATPDRSCTQDAGQSQELAEDMGMGCGEAVSRKRGREDEGEEEGEEEEDHVGDDTYQEHQRCVTRVRQGAPNKGGGGGGGKSCPRGGKKKARVAGKWVTQAERRAAARMGPEGLGDVNEGNDGEAYAQEESRLDTQLSHSTQLQDSGDITLSSSVSHTASTQKLPAGYILYNDGAPYEEIQVLGLRAGQFLTTLSSGCNECLQGSRNGTTMVSNPLDVFRVLIYGLGPGGLQSASPPLDSCGQVVAACTQTDVQRYPQSSTDALKSVVLQCVEAEILDALAQLMYWVNTMHFAAMVMRECKRTFKEPTTIFREIVGSMDDLGQFKLSIPILQCYLHDGTKIAMLAGAGSMYLVVILACCRVRQDIKTVNGEFFGRIARELRMPHKQSPFYSKITDIIIPAIAHLMRSVPLVMSRVIPRSFLDYGGKLELDCTNLEEQDAFFDGFQYNDYIKERNWELWRAASVPNRTAQMFALQNANSLLHVPLNPYPPSNTSVSPTRSPLTSPSRSPTPPLPDVTALRELDFSWDKAVQTKDTWIIETGFDPSKNTDTRYNREDAKSRYEYTQTQRAFTHGAKIAQSVEELDKLLKDQLKDGKRRNRKDWIYMDSEILQGRPLCIKDKNGNALVTILPPTPSKINSDFFYTLKGLFPNHFNDTDSAKKGIKHTFPAFNVDIYGRYSTRGDGVPSHVDSSSVQRPGVKRSNTAQYLPRTSQDWNADPEVFQRLSEGAAPLFSWLREQITYWSQLTTDHDALARGTKQ